MLQPSRGRRNRIVPPGVHHNAVLFKEARPAPCGRLSWCLGLLGIIAVGGGAFALWLTNADLRPLLEREASDRLQRRITIGAVKIGWGDPLAIEIRGTVIATMNEGDVDRALIEQASADLRSLFRTAQGRVPIGCLLGVVTLEDGTGELSLRLDSPEARLEAAGEINVAALHLDLTLRSDRDTSGFFALDVPIAIRGPLDGLTVTPLAGNGELADSERSSPAKELPAALLKLVRGSACLP